MSLPIKDTPVLSGRDANKFIKQMELNKKIPEKEYERAKELYEDLKSKNKLINL